MKKYLFLENLIIVFCVNFGKCYRIFAQKRVQGVCVECLIGKQKKPILFKVTEPSSVTALVAHEYACLTVGLGPVLASHAPSPPAVAAAAWRGRGRVPIAGWSCGGVGPERGLRRKKGVV